MSYTYLIKHIKSGLAYYGVRYSSHSTPNDLWDTYFTSSKYIKQLIEIDGKDGFLFEVRRVFDTDTEAIRWEDVVLRRLGVPNNPKLLNRGRNHPNSQKEKQHLFFLKYGVEFPFRVESIKEKAKETWLRNYGVDNPLKSLEVRQKQKDTLLERYGVESTWLIPGVLEKSKTTRLDRIGVEFTMQSPEHVEMSRKTQEEKYGGWRVTNSDVIAAREQASLEKYGVDNPFKKEGLVKSIMMEKYGVENWFQTEEGKRSITDSWNRRELMKCPYCNKESKAYSNMKRWHFDNCKLK